MRSHQEKLKFGNATAIQALYDDRMTIDNCQATTSAIFYNIYIPPNETKSARALEIISEQLKDIASAITIDPIPVVYYNTIGLNATASIQSLCSSNRLPCHHVVHSPSADEGITIQALHDYCNQTGSSRDSMYVTYLHSKGTYHDSPTNDRWRRALTPAALLPCCCDLCGLQFYTQFAPLVPGNMWSAQCSYIRQLVPPKDYARRNNAAIARLLALRAQGYLQSSLLPHDRIDAWGVDRYRYEHWVAGHPQLRTPCERVPPHISLQDIIKPDGGVLVNSTTLHNSTILFRAPQRPGSCIGHNWPAHTRLQQDVTARNRELVLLPGRLVQYELLYGRLPEEGSWQWHWFPDGVLWWQRIAALDGSALAAIHTMADRLPVVVERQETMELAKNANTTAVAVFLRPSSSNAPLVLDQMALGPGRPRIRLSIHRTAQTAAANAPLAALDQYCRTNATSKATFVAFFNSSSSSATRLRDCLDHVLLSQSANPRCCFWEDDTSFVAQCQDSTDVLGTLLLQRLLGKPVAGRLSFCTTTTLPHHHVPVLNN